jgi:hypothetical protein
MQKIQDNQRNCGVKLRPKCESDQVIQERIDQLRLRDETDTPEYKLLIAIQNRKTFTKAEETDRNLCYFQDLERN